MPGLQPQIQYITPIIGCVTSLQIIRKRNICYARVTVFLFPICRINTASMGSRVIAQGTPTVAHPERETQWGRPKNMSTNRPNLRDHTSPVWAGA